MEINIPNVNGWLINTLQSDNDFDVANLNTGYEAAIMTLNKLATLTTDEIKKETLFNNIHLLIRQSREIINQNKFKKSSLRLELLESFEINLRRLLSFDRSSYKPSLNWNGENNLLYELFVQLKNKHNKEGQPLIDNSYEDIALFLKTNFNVLHKTELSTINGGLRKFSSIVANDSGKVKLDIKG